MCGHVSIVAGGILFTLAECMVPLIMTGLLRFFRLDHSYVLILRIHALMAILMDDDDDDDMLCYCSTRQYANLVCVEMAVLITSTIISG